MKQIFPKRSPNTFPKAPKRSSNCAHEHWYMHHQAHGQSRGRRGKIIREVQDRKRVHELIFVIIYFTLYLLFIYTYLYYCICYLYYCWLKSTGDEGYCRLPTRQPTNFFYVYLLICSLNMFQCLAGCKDEDISCCQYFLHIHVCDDTTKRKELK